MAINDLPTDAMVAISDIEWYVENPPTAIRGDADKLAELLRAAETLSIVVKRSLDIQASRIGADDYLSKTGHRAEPFYAGVSFALAKVRRMLRGLEGPRA